jgi:hypothetical protein
MMPLFPGSPDLPGSSGVPIPIEPKAAAEQFISEAIEPLAASGDVDAMSRGEPGVPHRFTWRSQPFEVAHVLATWKTSTRERGDLYLRRHWFHIATTCGRRMKLYCERQTKTRGKPKSRWWLYTIDG